MLGGDLYIAFCRKTVGLIAAGIAASVFLVAALVLHIAATQDARSATQTAKFVGVSISELQKGLNRSVLDNADWGAAYAKLHLTTDEDWAFVQNNIGRSTFTDLNVDLVAVVGPNGNQTYGLVDGELNGDVLSSLEGGVRELVAKAKTLQAREIANAVLSADGVPIVAAAAILSSGGDETIEAVDGPPSVLFFGVRLTPKLLATLADTLQLDTLALPKQNSVGDDHAFLRTSDGSAAFSLVVSAPTPGRDMLVALIPWLMITGLLFGYFLLLLARQGLRVADLTHAATTALAASNLALEQQANIDVVTTLPNRAMFLNGLRKNLILGSGSAHVLFLDLDRFKPVNDVYGHAAGDAVLREVAERLKGLTAANDLPARLGGDEFVLLSVGRTDAETEQLAASIIDIVSTALHFDGVTLSIGVSIGITRIIKPGDTIESVLQRADAALYAAKAAGRMTYRFAPTSCELVAA